MRQPDGDIYAVIIFSLLLVIAFTISILLQGAL